MNWFTNIKKAMPLSPDAWEWHEKNHRLQRDKEVVKLPWGTFKNRNISRDELKQNYQGVHATINQFDLAAVYANNIGTPQDPPIVLEFVSPQQIEKDIDASHVDYDGILREIKDDEESREVAFQPYDRDAVDNLMDNLRQIDMMNESEMVDGVAEMIFENAKNYHPSSVVSYFRDQYDYEAPFFFYRDFLMPLFHERGTMDTRWHAYVVNQVRFMSPVHDYQIVGIYLITPWKDVGQTPYGHDPETDEEDFVDEEGYQRTSIYNNQGFDFTPSSKQIWRSNNPYLFNFPTYYHGTSLSRARQALPEMHRILDSIKL